MNTASIPPQTNKTRTAILGARGIGRHHAKWWHHCGVDVCAFLGTSPASNAVTQAQLVELFGFSGGGYTALDVLLAVEKPHIVDVCTPPAMHYEHVATALAAGCHVLCEKPYLYDTTSTPAQLVTLAKGLHADAESKDLRLGLCSQFFVAGRQAYALWQEHGGGDPLTRLTVELATPSRGEAPDAAAVWLDLGAHVIAALQAILPQGDPVWPTLTLTSDQYTAQADFDVSLATGGKVACRLQTSRTVCNPTHIRRISINAFEVDVIGEAGPQGSYWSLFRTGTTTVKTNDVLQRTIQAFAQGEPMIDGSLAVENLSSLLKIHNHLLSR